MQTRPGNREELIATYTAKMIKRGAKEVRLSLGTALTVHDWELIMESPLMAHGVTQIKGENPGD
jgi:hypothetical protein